jgi:hypothetical protein
MIVLKPTTRQLINRAVLAILAAYALTTIHHIYGGLVDRAPNRLRVPVIMAIPSLITLGSLYRYKRTGSGAALATSSPRSGAAASGRGGRRCPQTRLPQRSRSSRPKASP